MAAINGSANSKGVRTSWACVCVGGSGCFFGYLKQRRNADVWSEFIVLVMLPLTVREWEICENWKSDTVVIRCVKKKEWINI